MTWAWVISGSRKNRIALRAGKDLMLFAWHPHPMVRRAASQLEPAACPSEKLGGSREALGELRRISGISICSRRNLVMHHGQKARGYRALQTLRALRSRLRCTATSLA